MKKNINVQYMLLLFKDNEKTPYFLRVRNSFRNPSSLDNFFLDASTTEKNQESEIYLAPSEEAAKNKIEWLRNAPEMHGNKIDIDKLEIGKRVLSIQTKRRLRFPFNIGFF